MLEIERESEREQGGTHHRQKGEKTNKEEQTIKSKMEVIGE